MMVHGVVWHHGSRQTLVCERVHEERRRGGWGRMKRTGDGGVGTMRAVGWGGGGCSVWLATRRLHGVEEPIKVAGNDLLW
jgi:hypothetical protein